MKTEPQGQNRGLRKNESQIYANDIGTGFKYN